MMIKIGSFFFRFRNAIFPCAGILLIITGPRLFASDDLALVLGLVAGLAGTLIRGITVGLQYIKRGGLNRQVYADTLVEGGMFAHCRNPLYIGNFLQILSFGLVANSRLFVFIAVPFFVFAYLAIVAAEENFLRNKFGPQYDDYCRRVSRFGFNLLGMQSTWRSMEFHWKRVIVKEHGTIYLWLAVTCLLVCRRYWVNHHSLQAPMALSWIIIFLLGTVAYLVVRYLKKSKLLVAD